MAIANLRVHQIAHLALRSPYKCLLAVLAISILAAFGLARLEIDTSLTKLFHGETAEYARYQRLLAAMPASEHDVYVLVRGKPLFEAGKLEALRGLHLELRLVDPVRSVVSIFSAHEPLAGSATPAALLSDDIPAKRELPALEKRLLEHALVKGRLLSPADEDGQDTLLVVSLDPAPRFAESRSAALEEINSLARELLIPAELSWTIGGVPAARGEMLRGIQHDFVFFNTVGFAVGIFISALFFRRLRYVVIVAVCPLVGAFLSIGMMSLAGVKISPLLTAIPLLVMAVTFTDSMHLLFAIKQRLQAGSSTRDAIRSAVDEVGPACILASVTTAAALFSLVLARSPLVASFGFWAGFSSLASVLSLMLLLPSLAVLLLSTGNASKTGSAKESRTDVIDRFCDHLAVRVQRHAGGIVVGSVALTVVLAILYSSLQPQYRLSDQLPEDGGFARVNAVLDDRFAGANQVFVLAEPVTERVPGAEPVVGAVRRLHKALALAYPDLSVLSIMTLVGDSTGGAGLSDGEVVERLARLPDNLLSRMLDRKDRTAIVSMQLRDIDARQIAKFADEVETLLGPVRRAYPAFRFTVTGMPVLLARETPKIVREINRTLIAAFVIVFVIIGAAFRSLRVAAVSLVPNLLPVFAAGGLVFFITGGLDYASVVGLTVAFGLAVDDTAHFLNRLLLSNDMEGISPDTVAQTIRSVGPVLIVTTIVLMCALAITVFSEMPPTRIFGQTCVATLIAALFADLIVLPALVLKFGAKTAPVLRTGDANDRAAT